MDGRGIAGSLFRVGGHRWRGAQAAGVVRVVWMASWPSGLT